MPLAGRAGWIEKRLVASAGKVRQMRFASQEVPGYSDNPHMIIIADSDDGPERYIILERSFADNLNEKIDKETIVGAVNRM
jgi:hypothetical protein